MHLVASVCPYVCLSDCNALLLEPLGVCLCVSNQWAYADSCAEAVDRLLIIFVSYFSLLLKKKTF